MDTDHHRPDVRARTLWMAAAAAPGGLVGLTIGVASATAGQPVGLLAVPVLAVPPALWARALWARRTWRLGPEALEIRRGLVVSRFASIPYHRIQQIDVERGPLERLVGLAQLVVRTAAATTDATVIGLAPAEAEHLRIELLERADVDDIV